jgi:proteasome alpha subunit
MKEDQPAYDQAITVFSPDGRLYQVEYAREAVKRGATSLGVKFKTGVVLIVEKRLTSKLVVEDSIKKLFSIDKQIGCTSSGLVADTQVLVDYMRVVSQLNRIQFNERITVEELVKKLSNLKRSYTQFGGARPFGVAFLVGGIDQRGVHLFETDVSGAFLVYDAGCIGQNGKEVNEFFEAEYKSNMSRNEGVALGLKAMKSVMKGTFEGQFLDMLIIEKDKEHNVVPPEEIQKFIDKL